jgi:hypothetical protein
VGSFGPDVPGMPVLGDRRPTVLLEMPASRQSEPDSPAEQRAPLVRWQELVGTSIGSALAALVLSRLGIAGTIIGAALTPPIITLTAASLSTRLGRVNAVRGRGWTFSLRRLRGRRLNRALLTAALAFAIVAGAITVAEALAGKPISDWGRRGGSGYTFAGGAPRRRSSHPTTQPAPAASPRPPDTQPRGPDERKQPTPARPATPRTAPSKPRRERQPTTPATTPTTPAAPTPTAPTRPPGTTPASPPPPTPTP